MTDSSTKLAFDINQYLYDADPYMYTDDNSDIVEGFESCLSAIENGKTAGIMTTLDEYDDDPTARHLASRLRHFAE